jgi:hypothetical protein
MLAISTATPTWEIIRSTFKLKFKTLPHQQAELIADFEKWHFRFASLWLGMIDQIPFTFGREISACMKRKLKREIRTELDQECAADIADAELEEKKRNAREIERRFRADMANMVHRQTQDQMALVAQTMHSFKRERTLKQSKTLGDFETLQDSNELKEDERETLKHAFRIYSAFIKVQFDCKLGLFSMKDAFHAAFVMDYLYLKELTAPERAKLAFSKFLETNEHYNVSSDGTCMLKYSQVCTELLLVRDLDTFSRSLIILSTHTMTPGVEVMLLHKIRSAGINMNVALLKIMFGISVRPNKKRKIIEDQGVVLKVRKCCTDNTVNSS